MKRLLLLCALLSACRDVPDHFAPLDPFDSLPAAETGRLTWNVHEDHSPAWNATSESIYYSARSYPYFPVSRGLLLGIPRTPGSARLLFESLQPTTGVVPWLAAPAVSPTGESLAFVELTEINDPTVECTGFITCAVAPPPAPRPDTGNANVMLVRGTLRVRALNGVGAQASLPIFFAGKSGLTRIAHPYQRQFERDRAEIFRPSWSPAGNRLVFSDGLRLLIWDVGAAAATPIPNTDDGVWPAWSPDGDVIAFTRLLRGRDSAYACACFQKGAQSPSAILNRVVYDDGGARIGTLTTIRPDGTDVRELGAGEAPAWTPDGQFLVFQRNRQLWRATRDGADATPLQQTEHAYEPAISRNGQWLTFSRDAQQGVRPAGSTIKPYDIWAIGF